eukprot:TRINITY_DN72564_c0_g1_i1.p1 TRINITY_DN72564_c0_g1~~TRINITY_DN72564_c0_g1_i1.p1  ORF type:complete len:607 (-),score=85.92 TRINITY_DN72564_c0_g1_i1:446-2266(-)
MLSAMDSACSNSETDPGPAAADMTRVGSVGSVGSMLVGATTTAHNRLTRDRNVSSVMEMQVLGQSTQEWLNRDVFTLDEGQPFLRTNLWKITSNPAYDIIIGSVICFNFILIVLETDFHAMSPEANPVEWHDIAGYVLMAVYIVDCMARIYVQRARYFCGYWNLLDFTLVAIDLVLMPFSLVDGAGVPSFAFVRVLRLLRLLRFLRVLRQFKELDFMLYGLVSSAKAIFWASLMLGIVLTVFSIVIVQFVEPIYREMAEEDDFEGCRHCKDALKTVMHCNLHLVHTVIAGDSWGQLALPLIKRSPAVAGPLMVGALLAIQLGLMNLVLTVIVNAAQTAYDADIGRKLEARQRSFEHAKKELLLMCEDLDKDSSGCLTIEEISAGYDASAEFQTCMQVLDLGQDEVNLIFSVMDEDHNGTVSYVEFVEQLYKMKTQETHTLLIFMKGLLQELRMKVNHQLDIIKGELMEKTSIIHEQIQQMSAPPMTVGSPDPVDFTCESNAQSKTSRLLMHTGDTSHSLEGTDICSEDESAFSTHVGKDFCSLDNGRSEQLEEGLDAMNEAVMQIQKDVERQDKVTRETMGETTAVRDCRGNKHPAPPLSQKHVAV